MLNHLSRISLGCAVIAVSSTAFAQKAADLSGYDCTLSTRNETVSGAELVKRGYQVINRSRIGEANVMLSKPNSSSLVGCYKRQGAR